MAVEIERKFLVASDEWRQHVSKSVAFHQGYLSNNKEASVRIRIEGKQANINIKGMTIGASRPEYEYAIPVAEAKEMLQNLCAQPQIEKTRHYIELGGKTWELDEFHGDNSGLIVAEVELEHVDETFTHPDWLGKEVTEAVRYYNVMLTKKPYSQWSAAEKAGN